MPIHDTTEAITELVKRQIKKQAGSFSGHIQATFISADSVDPNLSTIQIYGKTATKVRKLNNVGTMTSGQPILCLQGGGLGVIIIGVIIGKVN